MTGFNRALCHRPLSCEQFPGESDDGCRPGICIRTNLFLSLLIGLTLCCTGPLSASPCFLQVDSKTSDPADKVGQSVKADNEDPATNGSAGQDPEDEFPLAGLPPLRRMVLYNSGVGQLQHEGKVTDRQRFEIRFGAQFVDDVIKSLVFADDGGGVVRAIEYQPAPEPEDVAANTIGSPMTMAQLLQRFRGEAVTVTTNGTDYRGTVYGVENRKTGEVITEMVVLMTDDGLYSLALPTIDRVRFDKDELRKTLRQAMQGIVKSRKANEKTLEFLMDGKGQRTVRFAYVIDMPIWRMTYRLAMEDDKVYLQGWAHVDNITGVDWEDVQMELRSGKPQSFHINIFAPLMAERPDFGDGVFEFTEGLRLMTQWFGLAPATDSDLGDGGGGFGGGGGGGGLGGVGGGGRSSRPSSRRGAGIDIESAFRQAAQESRSAQMVRYVLDEPVNLGAGRSAALPVFRGEVPAKLISVFDASEGTSSPFRAVEITNSTDYSVVSGPLSIMRDGDFVGDGKLNRLDVDQKAEIVYGLDRAVEINTEYDEEQSVLASVSLDKLDGMILKRRESRTTTYVIQNRDTEPRTLFLYTGAHEQEETPEPALEKTPDGRFRFTATVPARSTRRFPIIYVSEKTEKRALSGSNIKLLRRRDLSMVELPENANQLFDKLIELQTLVDEANRKKSKEAKLKNGLLAEQKRVRDNLLVLRNNQDAAKPFLDKLQKLETSIEELDERVRRLEEELIQIDLNRKSAIKAYFE